MSAVSGSKSSGSASSSDGAGIGKTQDQFLTLLTTQLKSQDPLSPMDNAQFTSQMAQISAVSGIEKLQATMQSMLSAMGPGQISEGAALMGKKALAFGNQIEFKGGVASAGVGLEMTADSVQVTVLDATTGKALQTLEVGPKGQGWTPVDLQASLPDGRYRIEVKASAAGQEVAAEPLMVGEIRSVLPGGAGAAMKLGMSTGAQIEMSQIVQIVS